MKHEIISRIDACAKGLKRFYTGKPCGKGHDSERYVTNGCCIKCQTFSIPSRTTPKNSAPRYWPAQGLMALNTQFVTTEEAETAFRFIEGEGWFDSAIQKIRNDTMLSSRYGKPVAPRDIVKLEAELARARNAGRHRPADDLGYFIALNFTECIHQIWITKKTQIGDKRVCDTCKVERTVREILPMKGT